MFALFVITFMAGATFLPAVDVDPATHAISFDKSKITVEYTYDVNN